MAPGEATLNWSVVQSPVPTLSKVWGSAAYTDVVDGPAGPAKTIVVMSYRILQAGVHNYTYMIEVVKH